MLLIAIGVTVLAVVGVAALIAPYAADERRRQREKAAADLITERRASNRYAA